MSTELYDPHYRKLFWTSDRYVSILFWKLCYSILRYRPLKRDRSRGQRPEIGWCRFPSVTLIRSGIKFFILHRISGCPYIHTYIPLEKFRFEPTEQKKRQTSKIEFSEGPPALNLAGSIIHTRTHIASDAARFGCGLRRTKRLDFEDGRVGTWYSTSCSREMTPRVRSAADCGLFVWIAVYEYWYRFGRWIHVSCARL